VIYDATGIRNVGQPIYARIRANSNPQFQAVKFLVGADYTWAAGSQPRPTWSTHPILEGELPIGYFPRQVTEAKYMINMALLRPHGLAGVTLTAKNHFGSIHFPDNGAGPEDSARQRLAQPAMGSYNTLVDLMGTANWAARRCFTSWTGCTPRAQRRQRFQVGVLGDQWASSILMSQDPVAIDSVALDLLRNEPRATQVRGYADNYLHEAAQAARLRPAPLQPDGSGPLASLGVHEHWNGAAARKYSRNLGRKEGIELIAGG